MRFEVEVRLPQVLDDVQARLTRPRALLRRIQGLLSAETRALWERIEALPFRSRPAQPRVGGFAVRTGRLRRDILEGIRITERAVVAGSSLFYAGYVERLVRERGLEGLLPTLDVEEVVADELVGQS